MATVASKGATATATTRRPRPKSKGRQMAFILNKARRQVTFSKRKAGLLNKARELALLCGAEVAVILFSGAGRLFTFGSPSVDDVLRRLAPLLPGEEEESAAAEPAKQTRVACASAEQRKEKTTLARAPRALEARKQMLGSGRGMGSSNAMDDANGYVYQNPRLAGDHYQYFADDMAGFQFQMQAPGSNANADDGVWPNLCGIDDWSCDAVVPAEYPYPSVDVAGSSSYKQAGDEGCNFIGENSYDDYDTQRLLNGDLHCPDTTSHCFGLDEQLSYFSDVAEGFVF